MSFDTKVPNDLKETQKWFGSIISQRIDPESHINPIAPSGVPIKEEAPLYISPSPTLEPHRRIELYHQQYWWRLLNTLQDAFPLTVRLFGYTAFNESLAKPYLLKYPPSTWSLNPLGNKLAEWVEKYYTESDKTLVLNSVKLDYLYIESFVAEQHPPFSSGDEETMAEAVLTLQPHVQVIAFPYNLCVFRKEILKESVEFWGENPLPTLAKNKKYYFALARTKSNDIGWSEISLAEYLVLGQLKKPQTIMELCEWIEKQQREVVNVVSQNLQSWFQSWTARGWLYQHDHSNILA